MKAGKKDIILYVISGILLAGYLCVLFMSMDVSATTDAYRLFYITGDLKYFATDEEFSEYRIGKRYDYTVSGNYKNLGKGWGDASEYGSWMKGSDSTFYLYADDVSGDHKVVIDIAYDDKHNNRLYVNGNLCGEVIVEDGRSEVKVPSECLVKGLNEFRVHTDDELYVGVDQETGEIHTDQNMLVKSIGVW